MEMDGHHPNIYNPQPCTCDGYIMVEHLLNASGVTIHNGILPKVDPFYPSGRQSGAKSTLDYCTQRGDVAAMDTISKSTTLSHRHSMKVEGLSTFWVPQVSQYMTHSLTSLPVYCPSEGSSDAKLMMESDVNMWDGDAWTLSKDPQPSSTSIYLTSDHCSSA